MATMKNMTAQQIKSLSDEAAQAGDLSLVSDCAATLERGKFTASGRQRRAAKRVLAAIRGAEAQQ